MKLEFTQSTTQVYRLDRTIKQRLMDETGICTCGTSSDCLQARNASPLENTILVEHIIL